MGPGVVAAVLATQATAAAGTPEVLLYGGVQVQNVWHDVITEPATIDRYDAGLVGIAYARAWDTPLPGVSAGFEGQANLHFGGQTYGEFNLPTFLRYTPPWNLPLRSAAFGLGPSVTTSVSEIEIEKGGGSQVVLFYWYLEMEFGPQSRDTSVFVRLHHRSNGFDTFEAPGSSNAIVLGLRRRF